MSRIGRKPVVIPDGVDVQFQDGVIRVKKGNVALSQAIDNAIHVEIKDKTILFSRDSEEKEIRAKHGLYRSLVHNMIEGVDKGYAKTLTIEGIGYRAAKEGNKLVLTVGLSHPVEMVEPEGITFDVPKPVQIIVKGADKQMVGEMAAKIRAVRPPEPYKGKGIRYENEVVRLREGKTGAK